MPVGHLSSLEKCLFKSYAHFLSCMRLLIYFGNLSHVGNIVGKYFFPLCRFLFILFMVSFAVPKLPSLIRSHWLIFAFIPLSWETDLRKHCCNLCPRIFCLYSLRSFMAPCLIFKSLSHCKFIFCV